LTILNINRKKIEENKQKNRKLKKSLSSPVKLKGNFKIISKLGNTDNKYDPSNYRK